MMFSIVLLGLIHGLVILPVYLASKIFMFLIVKMYIPFAYFHTISFHSPNEMPELLVVIFFIIAFCLLSENVKSMMNITYLKPSRIFLVIWILDMCDLSMYFTFCQDKPSSRYSDSCRKFFQLFRLSGMVPKVLQ